MLEGFQFPSGRLFKQLLIVSLMVHICGSWLLLVFVTGERPGLILALSGKKRRPQRYVG